MRRSTLAFFVVVLFAVTFPSAVVGQSTGGRIIGQVFDSAGSALPSATVTLTNSQTGLTRTATTNAAGEFNFPQVEVGVYSLEAGHAGFKKAVQKDVRLELNQVLTLNLKLQVGAREEVVEVTGQAPLIDTTSTQLGTVVNERAVTGLPLNARDTYQLLQLQPGVTGIGGADLFFGSAQAGAVSVNGGRGRSNNFTVNGGDANDLFINAPAVQPSPDAIQEFRVVTNTFDAEYGRNSGSVINVVTKSGTNSWHGSVHEFFRNKALNAKGFFDPETPDLKQNQFGGTFGGPIHKNKTFFFASYEGRRIVQGFVSDPVIVPTLAERNGDFSATPFDPTDGLLSDQAVADVLAARPGCASAISSAGGTSPAPGELWADIFPNSQIPTACMDPLAVDVLNRYVPLPTSGSIFQAIPDGHTNDDQFTVRIDHSLTEHQQLSGYYYFTDGDNNIPFSRFQAPSPNVLPGFGAVSATRTQQLNVSHTWTISPTVVNEFRFTYFRNAQGEFLHPTLTNLLTDSCTPAAAAFCFNGNTDTPSVFTSDPKLGITPNLGANREGLPWMSVSGGFTIGNNFEGEIPQIGNSYQWTDNFTKIIGRHTTKFGGDFRNQRLDQTLFFDINGAYSYFGGSANDFIALDTAGNQNLFPNFLMGLPDQFLQGSAQTSHYRTNSLYLYGQDSWKIKSNLTLNYGLRWELNTPFADKLRRIQSFRAGQATTQFSCQLSPTNPLNPTFGTPGAAPVSCDPGSAFESVFPLGLVIPGDPGVPEGISDTYYNSWAPRIGIAWSPNWENNWLTGGPGKTSIRAGFGIFYNPIEQLVLEQLGAQPPFGGSSLVTGNFFQTPFALQSCEVPCTVGGSGVAPNPFNGFLTPAVGSAVDFSIFRPILLFGQVPKKQRSQYTNQYNISIQRELGRNMALQIAYVGSQSHRLLATRDLNFGNAQTCLDLQALFDTGNPAYVDADTECGQFFADVPYGFVLQPGDHLTLPSGQVVTGAAAGTPIALVGLRPFSSPNCDPLNGFDPGSGSFINGCPPDGVPVFSSIFSQETIANASYNGLQLSLEKRFSHGIQLLGAYTWSKSLDYASTFEQILNPLCFRCNRSYSLFDARHRFVLSYLWQLPLPKYEGTTGKILNGWAISGITTFQTGFPIRILSSDDQELENSFDFELPGKPDQIGPFTTFDPRTHDGYFFDPTSFTTATLGTLGTAKRTICCGPGIKNFDISLQKDTPIGDYNLQFRAEFFNLFNVTQFLNPDGNITDGVDFGRVKRARDPRQIQFALKFTF
jgi:outer membrane receptor protein involved in Fe transport